MSESSKSNSPPIPTPAHLEPAAYTALLTGSLVLSKSGIWIHEGKEFTNQNVSNLFNRSIVWDESRQCFTVRLGPQQATFTVEDTPLFVVALHITDSSWEIELNTGTISALDAQSLTIGNEGQFYCLVNFPQVPTERHRARFLRAPHQILLQHAVDEFTLQIGNERVRPRAFP